MTIATILFIFVFGVLVGNILAHLPAIAHFLAMRDAAKRTSHLEVKVDAKQAHSELGLIEERC